MQDNTGQYNWARCFKHISENSYFQTFAINCFRENQSAWQLFVRSVNLILSTICWMLIWFSAVHFCAAVTSIPINSIVWVSKYTQPGSECLLPSFHRPLMNNHITLKIIVARRGDLLYCVWYLQYSAQAECCLSCQTGAEKWKKTNAPLGVCCWLDSALEGTAHTQRFYW